jgi:hypothetical protein
MSVTFSAKRNPTMADIARGKVDGKFDKDIVELAIDSNENLSHFVVLPCNNGDHDTTTIRTGIPESTWVSFYEGVQPSKGSKTQVTNGCGRLKGLIQVDKDLIKTQEDAEQEMGDEAYATAESMGMEVRTTVWYGNTKVNGKKFNGIAPVYSKLPTATTTDKEAAFYTLGAKRSTSPDNSALRSIWLIGHGRMGTALIYPKGTSAGLERGPVEDQTVTLADGSRLEVKEQFFKWTVGCRVKDFRKNVRICNIESNNLETLDIDLGELMLKACVRANKTGVNHKWYMPKSIYEWLCIKTRRDVKNGGNFSFADFEGKLILHFHGIPIFTDDALETNETAVA